MGRDRRRNQKRPREERRSQIALLNRLPDWARQLWDRFKGTPARELRRTATIFRSLARLLEVHADHVADTGSRPEQETSSEEQQP